MAAAKTKKKTTKKRKSRAKKKKTTIEKMRENSLSLNPKDVIAVMGGIATLTIAVVAILGWKFVTNAEYSGDREEIQRTFISDTKATDEKIFTLKFDDKELENQIELLEKEDDHIKEKIQEVVVRQQNTDSKVERIDKNIVILLQQSRLEPAPAPALRPLPNGKEASNHGE